MNNKNIKLFAILLIIITFTAICISIWAIWFRDSSNIITPDYAPLEEDPNATDIENDNDESKIVFSEGGNGVGINFQEKVQIDLSDNSVSLLFQNPFRSNCDVVFEIAIKDEIIVQSGKLVPGKEIRNLQIDDEIKKLLSPGGYDGKLIIHMYDQNTGEKAMVDVDANLLITVVE